MEQTAEQILSQVEKAAVTASTYTMDPPVRSIFSPENIDEMIKILVPVTAPVRGILPRVPGMGQAAGWKKLTSRLDPQAGGTGTRLGFADAGTPNETTQVYSLVTASYKNIGRDVSIGRQQIASNRGGNVENIRDHEEKVKMIEVLLGEEDIILNGDVSTQSTEFDGFAKSFTTNSGSASLLTASGVGVYSRTLFNAGAEAPTHLVCNARQAQALADDLQGTGSIQRIVVDNQGNGIGGVRMSKIVNPVSGNLIDVVTSRYSGAWAYLLTVTSPAGENYLEMEDLEPMSVYDVPNTTHAITSRVYETTVLKTIGEVYQYKVGGLATS
jgi:hypothetical protein